MARHIINETYVWFFTDRSRPEWFVQESAKSNALGEYEVVEVKGYGFLIKDRFGFFYDSHGQVPDTAYTQFIKDTDNTYTVKED